MSVRHLGSLLVFSLAILAAIIPADAISNSASVDLTTVLLGKPVEQHPIPAPPEWEPLLATRGQVQEEHRMGLLPSSVGDYAVGPPPGVRTQQTLPLIVDLSWREPPVGDQGEQNSCVGWATAYYYKTFQEQREHGWSVASTDHQFSPSFVYNQINGGYDKGSRISDALSLILNKGVATWAVFPYFPYGSLPYWSLQPTTAQLQAALPYRAATYGPFFNNNSPLVPMPYNNNLYYLKERLASGDTLVIAFPIYTSFTHSGGYSSWACQYVYNGPYLFDSIQGWHAVQVVGYNDYNSYFKIINSWGSSWGCQGYGYLSYNFVTGRASEAWWMIDRLGDFTPTPTPYPIPARFRDFLPAVWRN